MTAEQTPPPPDQPKPKKPRGFAAMDPKLVAEIARKGGKSAHAQGKAHVFTSDEGREAGRKGGIASHAKRRASQRDADDAARAKTPNEDD